MDTTRPTAPVIVSDIDDAGVYTGNLPSGTPSDDITPTLSGTAEIDSIITVKDGGTVIGTTTANGLGAWTFMPTFLPGNSTHAITVTATDASGNESLPASFTIVIDTVAPLTPAIVTSTDDVGIYTGNIASGVSTNDTTPTMSGTAEPRSLIRIFDDGRQIATTSAGGDGHWTFTLPALVAQGIHPITVTAMDSSGNESQHSAIWNVNIDTLVPATPAIAAANDNQPPVTGDIASGAPTNDTTPLMSGTAEGKSLVTIFDGATTAIGTTRADDDGNWSFTTPPLAAQGIHAITVTATDASGNESLHSTAWNVLVDTIAPATPGIAASTDNQLPVTGNVASGAATNELTPLMSGTAEAGSTVAVFDGLVQIGTTQAIAGDTWSFMPTFTGQGVHAIHVTATDAAGNVSSDSPPWNVNIDTLVPDAPVISASNDNIGSLNGDIPSGTPTNDPTPLMSGTAEAKSLLSLYDNGVFSGSVLTDDFGFWSYTPTLGIAATTLTPPPTDGPHVITTTATDAAGNVSALSRPWTVELDTTHPNAVITQGNFPNPAPVGTVIGTFAPNESNVRFVLGGVAAPWLAIDSNGVVTTTVIVATKPGEVFAFSVTIVDRAGNGTVFNAQIAYTAPRADLGLNDDTAATLVFAELPQPISYADPMQAHLVLG